MRMLKSILLVEDNVEDVELTLAALEQHKLANEVVVARDGTEALDYLFRRGKFAGLWEARRNRVGAGLEQKNHPGSRRCH